MGMFVAVAFHGTTRIATSIDGVDWTHRAGNFGLFSVGYGNGIFVAVGDGIAVTSTNGLSWLQRTVPIDRRFVSVAFGMGQFVAVGHSSVSQAAIITSPDGINWTARTSWMNSFEAITYGNGKFVAVAGTGVNVSSNGINWAHHTSPINDLRSIFYSNGLFIAGGFGNRNRINNIMISVSADFGSWQPTRLDVPQRLELNRIVFGNDVFVAIARFSLLADSILVSKMELIGILQYLQNKIDGSQ